jgi:hypothetical protein
MRKAAGKLEAELAGLREQIEARIKELTRTRAEAVRVSIEKSIVSLGEDRKETEQRRALVNHSVAELESLVAIDRDLCDEYRRRIQEALRKRENELKPSLAALVSFLVLEETSIKITLVCIHRAGLHSSVLVSSPPPGQTSNFSVQS